MHARLLTEDDLPHIRGTYRLGAQLAPTNWFRVGGPAEVLFKPEDVQDLQDFLYSFDETRDVTVIGVGSNLIVRDGGIRGAVIRLGRKFTEITVNGDVVTAGAAAMDIHVARVAADAGRAGLEFLVGIPGTIGGALAMNAGAYGREVKDVLIACQVVTRDGDVMMLNVEECAYSYRHYGGPKGVVFTKAMFKTSVDDAAKIYERMNEISASREASQPVRERTGGSTFANPEGHKAWQLIDAAGMRGATVGGAQVSPMHCNFLINTGDASAADLEALGEKVRKAVETHSGVALRWEIKRIGVPKP